MKFFISSFIFHSTKFIYFKQFANIHLLWVCLIAMESQFKEIHQLHWAQVIKEFHININYIYF